ncbi:MAG: acetoacetate--CoA ligase [Brevibacterium yomogidense]|uniref:acetoacetate--CoA ligase n=1 Tax=Brevibacterium sp. Mu109 TaxID=1255669 RepID=UPI000C5A0D38|nr:acetoacetate--CoA ligase [Brevibacterium sp. Mu109]SMX88875.1 acetoacetyl-CoA synthetase [Brevibacterium sp. Mu109]
MSDRVKLWEPSADRIDQSELRQYQRWLEATRGITSETYGQLHTWSVENIDAFWESVWEYFQIVGERGDGPVREGDDIAATTWFPGARVNFAENILRWADQFADAEAIVGLHETSPRTSVTWKDLEGRVGALAHHLRAVGVRPGDTVCAVLPSIPETVVALLATASVGAVWSVVNTDFGAQGVADRFAQIEPTVLLTVDGYEFNGTYKNQLERLHELLDVLPTVEHHILVDSHVAPDAEIAGVNVSTARYSQIVSEPRTPTFEAVEFSHPLWVLYSSGTTGKPKGIVHSHGGIVLEANKANAFHYDIRPGTRVYFAVSTTWVMWNLLVDSMMRGATIITYDGSPVFGTAARQLEICDAEDVEFFGSGAAVLTLVEKSGISPKEHYPLRFLRSIFSSGSPLPDSTWEWVYEQVKSDVRLTSDSGGTDIASGILGANPLDAVYRGELQSPYLGVDARTVDAEGAALSDDVGELVIAAPLPTMPVKFWNDPDGSRYRGEYFSSFDGLWRQGDWATRITDGGWVIHGRSDSTINRGGIRMGSADICQVVDDVPGVAASMVIGAELEGGDYYMPLFVVPEPGAPVSEEQKERIVARIRSRVSPRYVPDDIIEAPGVPRTRTGKLMEVPVKRIFQGADPHGVNRTTAEDSAVLDWYVERAARFARNRTSTGQS